MEKIYHVEQYGGPRFTCGTCDKSDVCKYKDYVDWLGEKLVAMMGSDEVKEQQIPHVFVVNIACRMYQGSFKTG